MRRTCGVRASAAKRCTGLFAGREFGRCGGWARKRERRPESCAASLRSQRLPESGATTADGGILGARQRGNSTLADQNASGDAAVRGGHQERGAGGGAAAEEFGVSRVARTGVRRAGGSCRIYVRVGLCEEDAPGI